MRDVTFQITGRHTFHAQECLELLRHFLNSFIGNEDQVLRRSSWQLGKAHFYTYGGRFTYDFQKQAHPSARDFLLRLLAFVTGSQPEIETVIRLRNIEEDRPSADADARLMGGGQTKRVQTQGEAGFEYIRAAVAKHPNLGIKVHPGNNHRITKSGHTGSIWIIPRHGGVSITANGQAAQRLYREMERILGPHHREDAKGYRYFQADKSNDVETIIGLWSRM